MKIGIKREQLLLMNGKAISLPTSSVMSSMRERRGNHEREEEEPRERRGNHERGGGTMREEGEP